MTRYHPVLPLMFLTVLALPITAGADDKRDIEGNPNWYDHPPSQGPRKSVGSELGATAPAAAAERRIVLDTDTRHANVTRGETVTFVYRDRAFTWKFDTLGTPNFLLRQIAPKEFGTGHVRVYVAPNAADLG